MRNFRDFSSLGSPASEASLSPEEYYDDFTISYPAKVRKANATFVMLARNGDLEGVIISMKQMEDRFNKEYKYPWTFLNEVPFSDEFKRSGQNSTVLLHN